VDRLDETVTPVPLTQRWQWATLQAKSSAEDGSPPEAWTDQPARLAMTLAFWSYMLMWPPITNGHGVIVPSRSRLGRTATTLTVLFGVAVGVAIFRWNPWIGAPLGLVAFPFGVRSLSHTIGTWHQRTRCTYLGNFLRHPDAPRGSALPLFETICASADRSERTLALHTRQPRLITLYESYRFSVRAGPNRKGRVFMTRPPNP